MDANAVDIYALSRRARKRMRREHRRLIQQNIWYECGCEPRCDTFSNITSMRNRVLRESARPDVQQNYPSLSEFMFPPRENPRADDRDVMSRVNVPLQFWFNSDPGLAIPVVWLPFGETQVSIQLADIDTMNMAGDAEQIGGIRQLAFDEGTKSDRKCIGG
jgi:hypothetical protein